MKLGIGLQNDRFALCISSMLGEEKMPYCWAAKSKRKHVGAFRTSQLNSMEIEYFDDLPAIWLWSMRYPCSLFLNYNFQDDTEMRSCL